MNPIETIGKILAENDKSLEKYHLENTICEIIDGRVIVYTDLLSECISSQMNLDEKNAQEMTKEEVDSILPILRSKGFIPIEKGMVRIESDSCIDCPAYQWVIHREGISKCRLNMDICEEDINGNWIAKPIKRCLRPLNVGASYLIAKELCLPEPMVGKLDYYQYKQYNEERERLCQ